MSSAQFAPVAMSVAAPHGVDYRSLESYRRSVIRRLRQTLTDRLVIEDRAPAMRNHMATFYFVRLDGADAVLKIVDGKPAESVDDQYAALEDLASLGDRFPVPEPLYLLRGSGAYLMGRARGRLMQHAVGGKEAGLDELIVSSARRAGADLAELHRHWAAPCTVTGSQAADDLIANCPWRLTAEDRALLAHAGDAVGEQVAGSRLYYDFDPCNVFVERPSRVTFLDPPDFAVNGPVHWDVGCFELGLRRACWRRPWNSDARDMVARATREFSLAYRAGTTVPWTEQDDVLSVLCQCGRLAQLAQWWTTPTTRRVMRARARHLYAKWFVAREWAVLRGRLQELGV